MASIKDAFEETLQDEHALALYIVFAIPLFLCTKFLLEADKSNYFVITALFTSILYLGFAFKCTSNVRSSANVVLPSLNIFPLLWSGLRGIIALSPLLIIAYTLEFFIAGWLAKVITVPSTLQIFVMITTALCNSIVYTGYVLFARRFRAIDVYNFKTIGTYCMDILIAVIFMKIQMLVINIIVLAPVLYLIWIFFGLPHPIATFYCCVVVVFNLAIMGHYMAQIDYETIKEC
jgi:hypothetical protein